MTSLAKNDWYREMTVYQIWTRSFCDGNGDGIGDLYGVISKLDYIKSLGVDAIWFSPIYPSPNADFGYDISDYTDIHPEYGTLEVFRELLDRAHGMGLRVFMDLVVNHTSDEHPWFQESRKSRDNPYHDYYIWRRGKYSRGKQVPPNNWTSMFEGDAWEYDENLDEYYLHLFAKKQPDLNMANPRVREEVKRILRFWLDMGVDGFREDVITYIGKAPGLPDSYPKMPIANGIKYYSNQPEAHRYLKEFRRDVLDHYDCFTVGESPMTTAEIALTYISEGPDKVLDEMIAFSHMEADCFMTDMVQTPFNLRKMKRAFSDWQEKLQGKAWNALYIENHDHPRIISRYGSEKYRVESGKSLACSYLFLRGTPFVYQGQEIGMTNTHLESVEDSADVSTFNQVARLRKLGMSEAACLRLVNRATRDHARTPVQWDAGPGAGFVGGNGGATPWYPINPNYIDINVADADKDPNSLLAFYRKAIALRRSLPVVRDGSYREFKRASGSLYAYARENESQRLLVVCSFSDQLTYFSLPKGYDPSKASLRLCGYDDAPVEGNAFFLRPYECRVYLFEN